MRSLSVVLAFVLAVAGCSPGTDNPPTAAPSPATASAPASTPLTVTAKTVEATVDTGCKPKVITDGCWLPLYARTSTKMGSAMNLGAQADTGCTLADTRGCYPQPGATVAVACMTLTDGEIWFGVTMAPKTVLTPDPEAVRTSVGEVVGFARATMFRLKDTFPQVC